MKSDSNAAVISLKTLSTAVLNFSCQDQGYLLITTTTKRKDDMSMTERARGNQAPGDQRAKKRGADGRGRRPSPPRAGANRLRSSCWYQLQGLQSAVLSEHANKVITTVLGTWYSPYDQRAGSRTKTRQKDPRVKLRAFPLPVTRPISCTNICTPSPREAVSSSS